MTNEQRLVIERECERLILHSAKLSDHANIEELAGLFTHDAELVRPSGAGANIVGRAAILVVCPIDNRTVFSSISGKN